MHKDLRKKLKALAILLIIVFAIVVYERSDFLFSQTTPGEQVANIWNPISAFLGIPTSRGPTVNPNDPFANTPDDFGNTPDDFGINFNDDLGFGDIPNDPFGGTPVPTATQTTVVPVSGAGTSVSVSTPAPVTSSTINDLSPTLLCVPGTVSEGEEAIVMYTCRDGSTTATASFAQNNEPLGSVRVSPAITTTYELSCSEGTSAQCSIDVANPALAILATPRSASRGGTVNISWKTKDTNECVVTSNDPNHRNWERSGTEGDSVSPSLFGTTTFFLTCETVSGTIEERSVTVNI